MVRRATRAEKCIKGVMMQVHNCCFCSSEPITFLPFSLLFSSSLLQLPTLGKMTSLILIIYLILVTELLVKCDKLSAQAPGVKKFFKTEYCIF